MPLALGDVRREARGEWLIERIAATGSVVLRSVGRTRAGEVAIQRFLSSPHVSPADIAATLGGRTARQCAGRRIVAIQDTTEINFAGASGRRRGFGPAGNGRDPGFFIHPVIAVDAAQEAVIGVVDAHIWTRPEAPAGERHKRRFEEKESRRWLAACEATAEVLREAAALTMIADREGDIYELFARRPEALHLLVRASQNRALEGGGKLFDALAEAPVLVRRSVVVAARGAGDSGRQALVEIKCGRVRLKRPRIGKRDGKPDALELTLVEACERDAPDPATRLCWRLLTTHAVEDGAAAAEIVDLYRLRWRIEQVFRALKRDGLRLEESQVAEAKHMFALAAMALAAAVRTIQLVDARDGSPRPATDVVDALFIAPLGKLSKKLEGGTARQKNPHAAGSLAWLSWIIARLGGWNCYYKPPGPKTMREGWNQLATFLAGYAFALDTEAEANV
jgi:hypothetical protein